jgi:hypothetical protein
LFTVLGEWLIELLFFVTTDEEGPATVPIMRTPQMIKKTSGENVYFERANEPKTNHLGDFYVRPGVSFTLRIDVPSAFVKEGERYEQVEMEYYRAELKYDYKWFIGVETFGLDRRFFPLWQIQAINVCLFVDE